MVFNTRFSCAHDVRARYIGRWIRGESEKKQKRAKFREFSIFAEKTVNYAGDYGKHEI